MSNENSNENSVVWQGYVAAIASLAQSMLFLMAVLTVALTQIAQQIGKNEIQPSSEQSEPSEKTATNQPVLSPNTAYKGRNASVAVPRARLKVVFIQDALELDPQQKKLLKAELASIASQPEQHWRIWSEYEKSDTSMQREAYLRVLTLRSELLANGVASFLIETNLIPKDKLTEQRDERAVYIDPVAHGWVKSHEK